MSSGYYVIPKLVEDTGLKRARTVLENGDEAIRVVTTNGGGTITVDAQDFADGTGLAPTQTYAGSVNHKLLTITTNSTTAAQNSTSVAAATGSTADTAWDGSSQNATVISLLKGIFNKL